MIYRTIDKTYFSYSVHKTRDRAEDALEEYFSAGEICESERPEIVAVDGRYAVMFPGV